MTDEKQRITISIPEGDEDLLEKVDEMVEAGLYENRTDVFKKAVSRRYSSSEALDDKLVYDAALTNYIESKKTGNEQLAERAYDFIEDRYGGSDILDSVEDLFE